MGCNWSKLLEKNRVKAVGVPWSSEEADALYKLKIPADFVRAGCLTREDYKEELEGVEKAKEKGEEKALKYMLKDELIEKAVSLGNTVTEEATKADLIALIESVK